jgi:alkaline phosphatase
MNRKENVSNKRNAGDIVFKKYLFVMSALVLLVSCTTMQSKKSETSPAPDARAKNIIFMIVDGMGFEHVKAARIYNGMKPLSYEQFPCKTKVTTCSFAGADNDGHCMADTSDVTDSAAAATAIATGIKVSNGAISRDLPKQSADIETILELAKRQEKSTGIIATKLFTDATPAAFVSHADDRNMTDEILADMFSEALPNVVFGADTPLHRQFAKDAKSSYKMVHGLKDLVSLTDNLEKEKACRGKSCPYVYGGFGLYDMIPGIYENKSGLPLEISKTSQFEKLDVPHLSQMTDAALKILSKNEQGFFLMVESSMPDMISHYNLQIDANGRSPKAIEVLIHEMREVENTVKVIENFVAQNPDTLVILTADHETGGLVIETDKTKCLGKADCIPTVKWTSEKYEPTPLSEVKHTNANVPLYAVGKGAERFCTESINNTDIAHLALAK